MIEQTSRRGDQLLLAGFIIAVILGAVVNKTNFCTMGAVSDMVNMGDYGRFRAWLLAVATTRSTPSTTRQSHGIMVRSVAWASSGPPTSGAGSWWNGGGSAGGSANPATRVPTDQGAPFHHDLSAGLLVFRLERRNEIEARVIDEVELVEVHMELRARRYVLQRTCQQRKCQERGGAMHVQLDLSVSIEALDF